MLGEVVNAGAGVQIESTPASASDEQSHIEADGKGKKRSTDVLALAAKAVANSRINSTVDTANVLSSAMEKIGGLWSSASKELVLHDSTWMSEVDGGTGINGTEGRTTGIYSDVSALSAAFEALVWASAAFVAGQAADTRGMMSRATRA